MSNQALQSDPSVASAAAPTGSMAFPQVAAISAFLVALSSIAYGFVYLFFVPVGLKGKPPELLTAFAANPTGRQIASLMLVLGGLGAATAAVGIAHWLRGHFPGWASWTARLGFAYGLLTALHGAYLMILFPIASGLYTSPPAVTDVPASAIQGGAIAIASLPSPLDPYGFSKFCLCGLWLLVTGLLMLRSSAFPRWVGWLALVGGVGLLLLFIGSVTGTAALILATGVPGTVIIGPLFWLLVGRTLWKQSAQRA